MDFKSLLNKLDSMQAPVKGIAAPELPKAVQLDEGAQLRVLSGQSTILAESALMEKAATSAEEKKAKDKKEEQKKKIAKIVDETSAKKMAKKEKEVDEGIEGDLEEGWDEMEADIKQKADEKKGTGKFDKKQTSTGTQYTRKSSTFTDGGDDSDTKAAKKKAKKDESVSEGVEEAEGKLPSMAHVKKMCQDGKSVAEICKMHPDCNHKELKQMVADCKSKLEEGAKPDANNDNIPDYAQDGKGAKDLGKGKTPAAKDGEKKGMSAKQEKFFGKKKAVKESVEGTLTFAKALQIIKESNGTAQIDPLDDQLWAWARRVAATKFNESVKADVYAATTYERMGGTWGIAQINE